MDSDVQRWKRLRDRWLLLALLAPLVVSPWNYDPTELPKLTYLRIIAFGLILTGLYTKSRSAWASSKEKEISEIHPMRLPILLLLIILGAAAFRSLDPRSSLAALVDYAMLAFYAFSFMGAARDVEFQRCALRWLVNVGAICALWALFQAFFHDPLNGLSVQRAGDNPTGPFANPIILSAFLAAVIPLASANSGRGIASLFTWDGAKYIILFLAFAIPDLGHSFAYGLCGMGLTLGLDDFANPKDKRQRKRFWSLWPAVACIVFIVSLPYIIHSHDSESPPWMEHHRVGLQLIREKPVLGWGPGSFGLVAPAFTSSEAVAHGTPNLAPPNSPCNEFYALGIAGGIGAVFAFCWVLAQTGISVAKRLHSSPMESVQRQNTATEPDATSEDTSVPNQKSIPSNPLLVSAWAGFLLTWILVSMEAPQSIALQFPFWCVLGLASTPSREAEAETFWNTWPRPVRLIGTLSVLAIIVPIPHLEIFSIMRQKVNPIMANVQLQPWIDAGFYSGYGAASRWWIGDLYYNRAVHAREGQQWQEALSNHLTALGWDPNRIGNWLGMGETADAAFLTLRQRPQDWVQYGKLSYTRAQKMQPMNGFAFEGEGRLLTQAYLRLGMKQDIPRAEQDFERAIRLYPGLARFREEYGQLEEALHHNDRALQQYAEAVRLGGTPGGSSHLRYGKLLIRLGHTQEALPILKRAATLAPSKSPQAREIHQLLQTVSGTVPSH